MISTKKTRIATLLLVLVTLFTALFIPINAAEPDTSGNVGIEEIKPQVSLYCYTDFSNIHPGKPYVPEGCFITRHDVEKVKSDYFISFVREKYGYFNSSSWKYHMETWEDDAGNEYECHYWQGPSNVTYYHTRSDS